MKFSQFNSIDSLYWILEYYAEFASMFFFFILFHLLLVTVIVEFIWPTHFFNRRHSVNFFEWRYRTFVEVVKKLVINSVYTIFLKTVWHNFYSKYLVLTINSNLKKFIFSGYINNNLSDLNWDLDVFDNSNFFDDEFEIINTQFE